jgi:hypothetical protein
MIVRIERIARVFLGGTYTRARAHKAVHRENPFNPSNPYKSPGYRSGRGL